MLEIGVFHNGASSLPVITTKDGVTLNDGSLAQVHQAAQATLVNQVRQGILAEKLGFQSFWLTEHHFQPEGAEMSPNPLMVQTAIAANTRRIRLGQAANIIVWHHPVRLAEQIATLDVISGGRVECGIGRGYQPRENETLGRPYGSTIQDQERNRKAFEEAVAILKKCWTEPSFSHHGENFSIPPSYTKWNHKQTIAYFQIGQGRAPSGGRALSRRSRHVFRGQSGAGHDDDAQGASGLPAARAETAPATVGAADQHALAQMGGGAWDQRRHDRGAERPVAAQHRDLSRGRREGAAGPTCSTAAASSSAGTRQSGAAS